MARRAPVRKWRSGASNTRPLRLILIRFIYTVGPCLIIAAFAEPADIGVGTCWAALDKSLKLA
jgi:hypothetical protein